MAYVLSRRLHAKAMFRYLHKEAPEPRRIHFGACELLDRVEPCDALSTVLRWPRSRCWVHRVRWRDCTPFLSAPGFRGRVRPGPLEGRPVIFLPILLGLPLLIALYGKACQPSCQPARVVPVVVSFSRCRHGSILVFRRVINAGGLPIARVRGVEHPPSRGVAMGRHLFSCSFGIYWLSRGVDFHMSSHIMAALPPAPRSFPRLPLMRGVRGGG